MAEEENTNRLRSINRTVVPFRFVRRTRFENVFRPSAAIRRRDINVVCDEPSEFFRRNENAVLRFGKAGYL